MNQWTPPSAPEFRPTPALRQQRIVKGLLITFLTLASGPVTIAAAIFGLSRTFSFYGFVIGGVVGAVAMGVLFALACRIRVAAPAPTYYGAYAPPVAPMPSPTAAVAMGVGQAVAGAVIAVALAGAGLLALLIVALAFAPDPL